MRQVISIMQIHRALSIAVLATITLSSAPARSQEVPVPSSPILLEASLGEILREAGEAVNRSDWPTAARRYREAIDLDPQEATLYNNLGVIERRRGNLDAAIAAYRQALDRDPSFSEVYPNLAIALLTTEQWQAALDTIALANASDVFEPLLPLYRAFAHEKLMQWEEAATAYELYAQSETNALGYYRGAIAHWQAGNGDAAARSFRLAAQLDPAFPLYTSEAGLVQAKLGLNGSAIELLSGLPQGWNQPGDFVILARLAHGEGTSDRAEAAISRALRLNRAPAAWVSDAGVILSNRGSTEAANRYLERVADRASRTASVTAESSSPQQERVSRAVAIASANLAEIYLQQERPALALSASQAAIEIDPLLPVAHNNFGVAAIALDRPNDAVAALEKAIEIDPDYWQAQRNLGLAYAHIGDRERARQHLQSAMDLAPSIEQRQRLNREILELKTRKLPSSQTREEQATNAVEFSKASDRPAFNTDSEAGSDTTGASSSEEVPPSAE